MTTEAGTDLEPRPQELGDLLERLERGSLSPVDQQRLGRLSTIVMAGQEIHSGPLPRAKELNDYDEETRRAIVQMAVDEQQHTHRMQATGLDGALRKDRRGQIFGLVIALTGLAVAAFMSIFSPTAAAIFGAIDLLGMVTVFVAPRVLETRRTSEQVQDEEE